MKILIGSLIAVSIMGVIGLVDNVYAQTTHTITWDDDFNRPIPRELNIQLGDTLIFDIYGDVVVSHDSYPRTIQMSNHGDTEFTPSKTGEYSIRSYYYSSAMTVNVSGTEPTIPKIPLFNNKTSVVFYDNYKLDVQLLYDQSIGEVQVVYGTNNTCAFNVKYMLESNTGSNTYGDLGCNDGKYRYRINHYVHKNPVEFTFTLIPYYSINGYYYYEPPEHFTFTTDTTHIPSSTPRPIHPTQLTPAQLAELYSKYKSLDQTTHTITWDDDFNRPIPRELNIQLGDTLIFDIYGDVVVSHDSYPRTIQMSNHGDTEFTPSKTGEYSIRSYYYSSAMTVNVSGTEPTIPKIPLFNNKTSVVFYDNYKLDVQLLYDQSIGEVQVVYGTNNTCAFNVKYMLESNTGSNTYGDLGCNDGKYRYRINHYVHKNPVEFTFTLIPYYSINGYYYYEPPEHFTFTTDTTHIPTRPINPTQLTELQSRYQTLQSRYNALESEHNATQLDDLQSRYNALETQYNNKTTKLADLESKYTTLRYQHNTTTTSLHDLQFRYNTLESEHNAKINILENMNGTVEILETKKDKQKERKDIWKDRMQDFKENLRVAFNTDTKTKEHLIELAESCIDTKTQLDEFQSKYHILETNSTQTQSQLNEAKKKIEELKSQQALKDSDESTIERLRQELADLQSRYNTLETELNEAKKKIEELESQKALDDLDESINLKPPTDLEIPPPTQDDTRIIELESTIERLRQELADLQSRYNTLETTSTEQQHTITKLTQELSEAKKKIEELESP